MKEENSMELERLETKHPICQAGFTYNHASKNVSTSAALVIEPQLLAQR